MDHSGMSMASSTMSGMGAMSTGTSSMSGMSDMSSMDMQDGMMMMSSMAMTFFTSASTPLWSMDFRPSTDGQYAGVCIFLIVLSFILRVLYAAKCALESLWRQRAMKRRYIVCARDAETTTSDADSQRPVIPTATLTAKGVTEHVKIVEAREAPGGGSHMPWRFSTDVPRAALVTLMVGVGYLLMLAVMTMNVGYFLSVLAGAFLGELFFGRFSNGLDEHAH